jgi:hypothetical protein
LKTSLSFGRVLVAVVLALMGAVVVWVAVPYNNFVLDNTYISDNYLPEIVVALLLLLVLAVNPLLRLLGRHWMLDKHQLALISGLLLFAAIIPSNGLMRMFPHMVASINQDFNQNLTTARIAANSTFRQSLFPDPLPTIDTEGSVVTYSTPVSEQFLDELNEGNAVPWRAWMQPMASWGMLILAIWIMMVGLGGVVYPQWRDNERLPFPLLNVYQAFIGDAEEGARERALPAIFYCRGFWIGCIVVFIIHGFRGLNVFTGAFPSFPLSWRLSSYYTDGLMRHAAAPLAFQAIFFSVVGVAYFIPSRYAISVWGWVFGYAWYITLGRAYIPAYNGGQVESQAFGALLAITGWVLFLGRAHWVKVGRAMFGKEGSAEEARRNSLAGWIFVLGCAGIVFWLYWAGASLWWSVIAMIACVIIGLLMARIIAETGVPALWISRMSVGHLTALFPLAWQSPVILLMVGVFNALVTRTTAVSAAVITTLALGIDREATPKHHRRLMLGGIAFLIVGFIVCGAVHLNMNYHHFETTTNPKTGGGAINGWERVDRADYAFFTTERAHQAVGLGVGTGLLWLCSRFPAWPIHPVGILFCRISIGHLLWFSVFLGWLLKKSITHLFGGAAYRKARPLFLGLIMGELLAVIVWTLVPVIIILATGADPAEVPRYTLMKYP